MVHPRLEQLMEYAAIQRTGLLAAVAGVPESLQGRRPSPHAWSVTEVLEHLQIVEAGVARLISRRLERARADGLGPETETGSVLRSLDRFALTEPRNSIPAPDFVRPKGALTAAAAPAALAESRRALRQALTGGDGLALGKVSAPHVLLGPLTLYEWVLFVGQHESRHTIQIGEIARQLKSAP